MSNGDPGDIERVPIAGFETYDVSAAFRMAKIRTSTAPEDVFELMGEDERALLERIAGEKTFRIWLKTRIVAGVIRDVYDSLDWIPMKSLILRRVANRVGLNFDDFVERYEKWRGENDG